MKKTLIFLHIPKTAGTSLARIFKENYIFWRSGSVYVADPAEKDAALRKMPEVQREKIRLVHGHLSFGVHELLPKDSVYVTYLRDPLKRVLSFYNYIFTAPSHYLYSDVAEKKMPLVDFIADNRVRETDNLQVRMLSGPENAAPIGGVDELFFQRAIQNVEQYFPVVGLSEYFDESLLLMRKELDWNFFPFYVRGKVNRAPRIGVKDLDKQTAQAVLDHNEWDQKLYEWAQARLKKQMEEAGLAFALQVKRFRRWNRVFQCGMSLLPVYKD